MNRGLGPIRPAHAHHGLVREVLGSDLEPDRDAALLPPEELLRRPKPVAKIQRDPLSRAIAAVSGVDDLALGRAFAAGELGQHAAREAGRGLALLGVLKIGTIAAT